MSALSLAGLIVLTSFSCAMNTNENSELQKLIGKVELFEFVAHAKVQNIGHQIAEREFKRMIVYPDYKPSKKSAEILTRLKLMKNGKVPDEVIEALRKSESKIVLPEGIDKEYAQSFSYNEIYGYIDELKKQKEAAAKYFKGVFSEVDDCFERPSEILKEVELKAIKERNKLLGNLIRKQAIPKYKELDKQFLKQTCNNSDIKQTWLIFEACFRKKVIEEPIEEQIEILEDIALAAKVYEEEE